VRKSFFISICCLVGIMNNDNDDIVNDWNYLPGDFAGYIGFFLIFFGLCLL